MPLSLGLQPGCWRSVWRGRFFNWILAAFFGQWAQSTKRSDGFGAFRFPKGILPINITVELVLHYIIIIRFKIQVFVICKIHQKLKISYNFHHIYTIFQFFHGRGSKKNIWLRIRCATMYHNEHIIWFLAPKRLPAPKQKIWYRVLELSHEQHLRLQYGLCGSKPQHLTPTLQPLRGFKT